MKTRRTGYTLLGLLIATLTVMSCTRLLGIDTETIDNPCSTPDLPPLECGVGACQVVLPACVNGLPQKCPAVTSTADEICDGIDNNCDGLIDEGCPCMDAQVQNCYSGAPLTRNVGVCITGIQICTNGVWGDCTGEVLPDLENCNDNFDNDCSGAVNDNCPCTEGQQRECYGGPPGTLGISNCKAGLQSCIAGFWGDCKSDIIPGGEVCDGFDNDCNGQTDEITGCECSNDQTQPCYTGDEKFIGVGVCKKGYFPCKGGKFDKMKCLTETLPSAEVCNGLDDDCNGLKDDAQGLGLDCQSKLPGLCKFGKTGCGIDEVTGLPGTICTPDVKPFQNPEQACNLVDDNCDSEVDEGTVCCPNDGIKNGSETDVNCGGTCPERCPDGKKCNTSMDCLSQVCTSSICVPITCMDGVENGTETDIDCGGTTCDPCPATKKCDFGTDCLSSVCIAGKCQQPTCIDGVKNGQESDKDCGDACKPALCANLQSCNNALDCQSFSCLGNICQASTCNDGTKNSSETDIDCGGGQCVGCDTGQGCNTGSDCKGQVCGANLKCSAPTCTDAAKNGQETDADCGGPDCVKRCDTGQKCLASSDCTSKICTNGFCAPSQCTDQVQNGTETDVDCGGSCPEKCNPTQKCSTQLDCKSDVCTAGICQAPSCMDGKKNGTETGTDCGGSCINEGKKCADGITCSFGGDCISGVCNNGVCFASQCNDQVKNGSETDIDCGGQSCQGCDIGKNCLNGPDCKTGICSGGKCAPKPSGSPCVTGLECASGNCVDTVCCNEACTDTCKACTAQKKGNGSDGICGAIVSGADPDNECATDSPTTCGKTGFCNGSAACENYPVTQQCVPATCKDLVTRNLPQFCNGVGACLTSMEQSCVPYTCQAGACLSTCALDTQCAGGFYCNANQCIPRKADGGTCNFSNECLNANCVDNVCCNSACTGTCQACSAGKKGSGIDGVCGPISNNNDPDNECATTVQSTCGTTGTCNGTGQCAQWSAGTPCASATCINSTTLSPSSTCNGSGTCTATMQISCTPYLCTMNACASICATNLDCAAGNYCLMTSCVAQKGDGASCLGSSECVNGNCVDNVCCNNACTGLCQACSAGKKGSGADGTCGNIGNNADPDSECMDGQCADATTLNVTQVCNGMGACKIGTTQVCTPYVCSAGPACPTTCMSDANCQLTHYCNASNLCVVKKAPGQVCGVGGECASSFCVDGVCCNNACNTDCKSCALAGNVGTCTNIPNGQTDSNPICSGTDVCNGAGICKKGIGQTCAIASDCASNFCADNVCCDTACATTCQACTSAKKGSGTDGTCGVITAGQDPDNECANGSCNGASTCKSDLGITCAVNSDCLSASCVDGVCCSTASCATCQTCNKNIMVAGTCTNIDAGGTDNFPVNTCSGINACNGSSGAGSCKKIDGQVCALGTDCLNTFCVDGVCCNSACTATCQACGTAAGAMTNGVCGNITAGTADNFPANACSGAGNSCDGAGNCKKTNGQTCAAGSECVSNFCVDGVCCNSACTTTCQACSIAAGAAANGTCGNIASGTQDSVPLNACTSAGSACDGAGNCKQINGNTCTMASQCISGNCVDGACCGSASCGTCQTCNKTLMLAGTCQNIDVGQEDNFPANTCVTPSACDGSGGCKKNNGQACTLNSECLNANCVDSVCCDTTCTGTCQACSTAAGATTNGVCGNIASGTADNFPVNTCSGTNRCDGMGGCKKQNGQTCAAGSECLSTNCVDGVCCNTACTTACQACSTAAGAAVNGTCGNIAQNLQDSFPANACTGGGACNGAGLCINGPGLACTMPGQCASGFCVDSVCCNSACTTACQACSTAAGAAVNGTCGNVAQNMQDSFPVNACTGVGACNASGLCKNGLGQTCPGGAVDCASGNCVDGRCCDTACSGTCQACSVAAGATTNGTCGNIASGTQDTFPANTCVTPSACDGSGACKKNNGQSCTMGTECLSANCVDGVCCNSTCLTACQACSTTAGAAANGTCGNITSGTQDNFPANTCSGNNACNGMSGAGACKKINGQTCAAGTECVSTFCADGVCCNSACGTACQACSIAAGAAADGTCGNIGPGYQDNVPANACVGANACNGAGTCVAKSVNGTACGGPGSCASNQCVDGVCCNSTCTTACFACSTAAGGAVNGTCGVITTAGTDDLVPANACTGTNTCDGAGACKKDVGQTCMAGECANGNCIDGYCCNTTCAGTCQACNVSGSLGTCSNTTIGTQEAGCTGINACNGAGACKLLNGSACVAGTECVSTFCADGVCCNAACGGTCQACSTAAKGGGTNGQCGPIAMGLEDTFPSNLCVMPQACNGSGMCL